MQIDDELARRLVAGVDKINEQHKEIFDFTNDLFCHCVGDDDAENKFFGETVISLVDLVVAHFKTEEDLMLETKLDVYEFVEHKKEHDEFVMTIEEYAIRFHATKGIDLLAFTGYAKWWIIGHIKRFDKKYVDYFNKITAGKGIKRMVVR